MPVTQIRGGQVGDGTIGRADLDIATVGNAVIRKIVQGSGITISSTGADAGTGDVTISASAGGGTVTSIAAGAGLTASPSSPITGAGTLSVNKTTDLNLQAVQTVVVTDAVNAVIPVLKLSHDTTATPSTALGCGIELQAESSTTIDRTMAQIMASWSIVTDASRTAYLDILTVQNAALTTALRIHGSNGLSLNNTTDPGAGFFNTPTAGGYKINNVNIFPVSLANGGLGAAVSGVAVGDVLRASTTTAFDSFPLNASLTSPANPTGTASTAGVMAGFKVPFTPAYSGKLLIYVYGRMGNNTANGYGGSSLYYGTGTAPNNGAAVTGTVASQPQYSANGAAANQIFNFSLGCYIALVKGTTYWFDLTQVAAGTGTFSLYNVVFNIIEL
jgi:hypothetical protein